MYLTYSYTQYIQNQSMMSQDIKVDLLSISTESGGCAGIRKEYSVNSITHETVRYALASNLFLRLVRNSSTLIANASYPRVSLYSVMRRSLT